MGQLYIDLRAPYDLYNLGGATDPTIQYHILEDNDED